MKSGGQQLLLIDDDPVTVRMLEKVFSTTEFAVHSLQSGPAATGAFSHDLDVVLLDRFLRDADAGELLTRLRSERPEAQVMVMTEFPSVDSCLEFMRLGAYDYLPMPFDSLRLVVEKARRAAERAATERELKRLKSLVDATNRDIECALAQTGARAEATVIGLVQALEARDISRRGHAERVGRSAEKVARSLGLGADEVELVGSAARMVDVGYVSLPDRVVLKPAPLTDEERQLVQNHVAASCDALSALPRGRQLLPLVRHHHERWDGGGYPAGLAGHAIPMGARIIAAADTFDALITPRPYREQRSHVGALGEMQELAGKQLDPDVVGALVSVQSTGAVPGNA